jgi:hypothetical protein
MPRSLALSRVWKANLHCGSLLRDPSRTPTSRKSATGKLRPHLLFPQPHIDGLVHGNISWTCKWSHFLYFPSSPPDLACFPRHHGMLCKRWTLKSATKPLIGSATIARFAACTAAKQQASNSSQNNSSWRAHTFGFSYSPSFSRRASLLPNHDAHTNPGAALRQRHAVNSGVREIGPE